MRNKNNYVGIYNKAGKIIVAQKDLKKGHLLEEADIALKRSGKVGDRNPMKYLEDVLGKRLKTGIAMFMPANVQVTYGANYTDTQIGGGTEDILNAFNKKGYFK